MRTYQIASAATLVVIAAGILGTATTGQTQALRRSIHDQGLESERAPELMILAQASDKSKIVAQSLSYTASEFENIARFAIKGEPDHVASSLRTIVAAVDKLKVVVLGQTYRNLTDRLSDMSEAQKNGDFEGVALAATEGYRTVRLAQDPTALPVPIEVYLLNYTGLKAMALARTETPDWQRLSAIGDETSNYWVEISPKLKQKALRNLMDTMIVGFKLGVAQENVPELRFVVELQFDAIDLLKGALVKK